MPLWKKLLLGLGGGALALLWHVWSIGFTVAIVHRYGSLAYLINFVYAMILTGTVLLASRLTPRLSAWLAIDPARIEKPFWRWVRGRGAFALVFVGDLTLGSIFAGATIRFLALSERKAWIMAAVANAATSLLVVSVYLGVIDILKTRFAALLTLAH